MVQAWMPHRSRHVRLNTIPGIQRLFSTSTESTSPATTTTTSTSDFPRIHDDSRYSRGTLSSLDSKIMTQYFDVVWSHLQARHASEETFQYATLIQQEAQTRINLIQERDAALNQRKEASARVGQLLQQQKQQKQQPDTSDNDNSDSLQALLDETKQVSTDAGERAARAEDQLALCQARMDQALAHLPNLLDDLVPPGKDDKDNVVVSTWGDIHALPQTLGWTETFQPLWHDDVARKLNGYWAEAAVQMSGARFVALSGAVAQLERALSMFFMDLHTSTTTPTAAPHGYTEVSVPLVVSRSTLEGTSQLPKFELDLFAITNTSHTCNGEDAFLIPTAEVPVTNLHRGQILEESQLPLSYVALTPCFRAEAGSYGRDTKGLIRTHQFYKVELVKITTAESSAEQHELLTSHAEACLQLLQLPYRKVRLCAGDIGFAARHCYDLEVWLPGAHEYREISSCSNCGDFQARRMGLRYRPNTSNSDKATTGSKNKNKTQAKPVFCHTINGSGLAVGRTLVAVLENYQRPDGSVVIPEVLRPYMGGRQFIEPPQAATK
jgi:seryl-tRNA synthetase